MKFRNSFFFAAFIMLAAALFTPNYAGACTSAIFSGKVTADGRPIMWKHRDTESLNNRVEKFKGEKYSFIALVNSESKGNSAWSGTNDAGFSIMNTASFNFYEDKSIKKNNVSYVMFQALSKCATLEDFEKFLDSMTPLALETHLAVIDAHGGAAYYECTDTKWIKMDVNDPRFAPLGYIAYTNHSFNGTFNEGLGYVRYNTAVSIINQQLNTGKKVTSQWIAANLSRSFKNSLMGIDLVQFYNREMQDKSSNWSGYFVEQDLISRSESTCATIMQGVKPGENPNHVVMYTILGYPPLGIAIPLMVNQELPQFMTSSKEHQNAPMCDIVLAVKEREIYNITRGNGQKYFNFKALYENYVTQIDPIEIELFKEFNTLLDKWRNKESTPKDALNTIYTKTYSSLEKILVQ